MTVQFHILLSRTLRPLIEVSEFWLSQPDCGVSPEDYREAFQNNCYWMAMEIFDGRSIRNTTKETDVWAFGMVILVIISRSIILIVSSYDLGNNH